MRKLPMLPPQCRTQIFLLVNSTKLQEIKIFTILKQSQRKERKKVTKFILMKPLMKKKKENPKRASRKFKLNLLWLLIQNYEMKY